MTHISPDMKSLTNPPLGNREHIRVELDAAQQMAAFVSVLELRAPVEATQALVRHLKIAVFTAASDLRTQLEPRVKGLAGAPPIPAEVVMFMRELEARGHNDLSVSVQADSVTVTSNGGEACTEFTFKARKGLDWRADTSHREAYEAMAGLRLESQTFFHGGVEAFRTHTELGVRV